jgi:hypothetical protein
MGRKAAVVGAVLDLTALAEGDEVDIESLIRHHEPVVASPKREKGPKPKKKMAVIPTLDKADVVAAIARMRWSCGGCKSDFYYPARHWQGKKMCKACHVARYMALLKEVDAHMEQMGLKECAFCRMPRDDPHAFNLDHINMYSKSGSVCTMAWTGDSIEHIKEEIGKCQLLCISCHAVVTHFERRLGFIKTHRGMHKDPHIWNAESYDAVMGQIYAIMRDGGGAVGVGHGVDMGDLEEVCDSNDGNDDSYHESDEG